MHQFHNAKHCKIEYQLAEGKAYELKAKIDESIFMQEDVINQLIIGLNIAQKTRAECYAMLQAQIDAPPEEGHGSTEGRERSWQQGRASSSEDGTISNSELEQFVTFCNKNGMQVPDCIKQQILFDWVS